MEFKVGQIWKYVDSDHESADEIWNLVVAVEEEALSVIQARLKFGRQGRKVADVYCWYIPFGFIYNLELVNLSDQQNAEQLLKISDFWKRKLRNEAERIKQQAERFEAFYRAAQTSDGENS